MTVVPTREQLLAALHDLLAVVVLEPLPINGRLPELPGLWSPRPDGRPGARVRLAADERLLVRGVATSGVVDLDLDDPAVPRSGGAALDDERGVVVWFFADATGGETWVGLTSSSSPRLRSFAGVQTYPDDDRWRLPVSFSAPAEGELLASVGRMRGGDGTFTMERAGWFTTEIDGAEYRLSVDRVPAYAYVNFRDAGSGSESYGAGRVVRLAGDPAEISVLDLNEAAVPPCAFNPLINCPVPQESNTIRTTVRAGQRQVLFDSQQDGDGAAEGTTR